MENLGAKVTCLHFITPFFGDKSLIDFWHKEYGFEVRAIDISADYIKMLKDRPERGFGQVLNPCIDCKVLMLKNAKKIMHELGAEGIISGEVVGQRPMSQRYDALNIIHNEADLKGTLLRPLSAKRLEETELEKNGRIDRNELLDFSGRGRDAQMALAKTFGFKKIPSPAGGCLLTETDKSRHYWNILKYLPEAEAEDFYITDHGRQFWTSEGDWLIIGRKHTDNQYLTKVARDHDYLIKLAEHPGPVAIGRYSGKDWKKETLKEASSLVASYSTSAKKASEKGDIKVNIYQGTMGNHIGEFFIIPTRANDLFSIADWNEAKEEIRQEARARQEKR